VKSFVRFLIAGCALAIVASASAQIQVSLKLRRLQYIAYEPVVATVSITNNTGRDIDLRDDSGQHWFGFEVSGAEGQPIAPASVRSDPTLHIEASKTVTRQINLAPIYSIQDFGTYHLRANIYFADLAKYFYSQSKAFQITDALRIWQRTVGIPEGKPGAGGIRTYSLMTNTFPDHTSLYVRVEDKDRGAVYATYSLGRVIAFDEPHAEIDRQNQLHVLHCTAPRTWAHSTIGLNGELLSRDVLLEAKTRPRLRKSAEGDIAISGGILDKPAVRPGVNTAPKLSERPADD